MIQSFKIQRVRSTYSTTLGQPKVVWVIAASALYLAATVTFVSLPQSSMSGGRRLLGDEKSPGELNRCDDDCAWDGDSAEWGGDDYAADWGDVALPIIPGLDDTPIRRATKAKDYEVFSREMLAIQMEKDVKNVAEIVGLSPSNAEQLLRYHKWSTATAIDAFFTNPKSSKKQAGIVQKQDPVPLEEGLDDDTFECPMCYDDKPREDLCPKCLGKCVMPLEQQAPLAAAIWTATGSPWSPLPPVPRPISELIVSYLPCDVCGGTGQTPNFDCADCGHQICNDCWRMFLKDAVMGRDCVNLTCSYPRCGCKISPELFRKHLRSVPEDLNRYERFNLEDYVANNKRFVPCPSPDCQVTCKIEPGVVTEVHCSGVPGACGMIFCTGCQSEGHRPSSCVTAANWRMEGSDEAATRRWRSANTKACPSCGVGIEKHEGSLHMTCRQRAGGCGHEFCWLCLGDWRTHDQPGFYHCNVYDYELNQAAGVETEAQNARERYTHYSDRFENHLRAVKSAETAKLEMQDRIEQMTANYAAQPGQIDPCVASVFLTDAVNTVIECRRSLAWTYPIAFYMRDDFPQKPLFTELQGRLEEFTDRLHELCEQDPDTLLDKKMRAKMIEYTRATKRFRDNMVKQIKMEELAMREEMGQNRAVRLSNPPVRVAGNGNERQTLAPPASPISPPPAIRRTQMPADSDSSDDSSPPPAIR